MKINPLAIVFWVISGLITFLFTETLKGLIIGIVIPMAISYIITLIDIANNGLQRRRRKY